MILNREQIEHGGYVLDASQASRRSSTYDATIGEFISEGVSIDGAKFCLQQRGIVWVVSTEQFKFPNNITGLATLKTTLTHKGILALNVGVIDPGYEGPLATALVNFSGSSIEIHRGDPFFRVVFTKHESTNSNSVVRNKTNYIEEIREKSRYFSNTFLNTNSLVNEVAFKVFKLPKIAVVIGWIGFIITIASIFVPILIGVWTDHQKEAVNAAILEKRILVLEEKISSIQQPNLINRNKK